MYLTKKTINDWKQINYRNVDSMLSVQFIYDLYDQYDAKINWFRFKNVCLYFQDGKLWSYTPLEDWNIAIENIAKQFKEPDKRCNPNIIKNSYHYCYKEKKLLNKVLKNLEHTDLNALNKIELYNLLFNWYHATLNQIYYINVAPLELGLQKAIDDLCVEYNVSQTDRCIIYSLDDNIAVVKEEYDILKSIVDNNFKINNEIIDAHYEKFKHITIGYGSNQMNYDELKQRYVNTLNLGKDNILNKVKHIESYPDNIKLSKKQSSLNIKNTHLVNLFDLAAKLGLLRDSNKALLGKSVYYRNLILKHISEKCDIDLNLLKYYLLEEIESLVLNNTRLSDSEIEQRKEGVYISSISNFITGEFAKENYYSFTKNQSKIDINTQCGICASPGLVKGFVKVCLSSEECLKLEKDEILVTYGTDFNYLDAMVRSAAIVTEEGGILSHASVISRELKKPCIIGFKEITKFLKDGDEIEVDATNGKIKVLNTSGDKKVDSIINTNIGIYSLKDYVNAEEVGNKAYNLMLLNKNGYNVPQGIVLGVSFFKNLLTQSGNIDKYLEYVKNLSKYQADVERLIDEIEISIKYFEGVLDFDNTYAVRSSSPSEDSDNKSFAGQFVTELFCDSLDKVIASIKKCWKSFLNKNLEIYSNNTISYFGGIIVQQMVNADFAGVMFTKNPVRMDNNIVVECCKGVASKLVDNKVNPNRYYIDKSFGEIKTDYSEFEISSEIIKLIADMGIKIRETYKADMDVEWAFYKNNIYVIQARPITT